MARQRILISLILICAGVAAFFMLRTPRSTGASNAEISTQNRRFARGDQVKVQNRELPAQSLSAKTSQQATPLGSDASPEELESLKSMVSVLSAVLKNGSTEEYLLKLLKNQGPQKTVDRNQYTGDMDVIRTSKPLPGTRYLHAQFFGTKNSDRHLQHLSFEFKPGPKALQQAIDQVRNSFGLGQPEQSRENFFQWELPDSYCVWVSPLQKADMVDHPFNAYSAEDEGSIRVAVEICDKQ